MSSLSFDAKLYSGLYGVQEKSSDLLVCTLTTKDGPVGAAAGPGGASLAPFVVGPGIKRNLFFVVDVSGSMHEVMPLVRATLKSLNCMIGGCSEIDLTVVSFSETAQTVWPVASNASVLPPTFDATVDQMQAVGGTNLWGGIEEALGKISTTNPRIPSWVVVMTDGAANRGRFQTKDDLGAQVNAFVAQRPNTSFVMFGFGSQYRPDVLGAMGPCVHLPDTEAMNSSLTLALLEVLRAEALNCKIRLPERIYDPEVIQVHPPPRFDLIGTNVCQVFAHGSAYVYGCAVSGLNVQDPGAGKAWIGKEVVLSYLDLRGESHVVTARIEGDGPNPIGRFPQDLLLFYFQAAKGRMLQELSNLHKMGGSVSGTLHKIKHELDSWATSHEDLADYGLDEKQALDLIPKIDIVKAEVKRVMESYDHLSAPSQFFQAMSSAGEAMSQRMFSADAFLSPAAPVLLHSSSAAPLVSGALNLSRQVTRSYAASGSSPPVPLPFPIFPVPLSSPSLSPPSSVASYPSSVS